MDKKERREEKERKFFRFIKNFLENHGYSPSFREIAGAFGCSLNTVSNILDSLREKEMISFEDGKSRTIVIIDDMEV